MLRIFINTIKALILLVFISATLFLLMIMMSNVYKYGGSWEIIVFRFIYILHISCLISFKSFIVGELIKSGKNKNIIINLSKYFTYCYLIIFVSTIGTAEFKSYNYNKSRGRGQIQIGSTNIGQELVNKDGIYYPNKTSINIIGKNNKYKPNKLLVDPNKPYSGLVHGWRRDNGTFYVEGTLKNGRFDGLYTVWYKGLLDKLEEGKYKDGEKNGVWTGWYRAVWTGWYFKEQQKEYECTYKNDKVVGQRINYRQITE